MKKTILLICMTLFSINSYSQTTEGVLFYVDSLHNIANEENYKYTRIVEDYDTVKDSYIFSEYYKSGKRSMKALSKNRDILILDGLRIDYYENGYKEQVSNYKNNYLNGKQVEWYENQNKKIEREIQWDSISKKYSVQILQFWNKDNEQKIVDGNGEYEETTLLYAQKGTVNEGYKEEKWTGNDFTLNTSYTETYSKGELISGISTDESKTWYPYLHYEEQPHPRFGLGEFYQFFDKNLKIPNSLKKIDFEYHFSIEFMVDKNGALIEPNITTEFGLDLKKELTRIISKAEKWIPGKKRGISVKTKYKLPIAIKYKSFNQDIDNYKWIEE